MLYTYEISPSESGVRLDRFLKKNFPQVPYSLLQKLLRKSSIRVNGKRVEASYILQEKDALKIRGLLENETVEAVAKAIPKSLIDDIKNSLLYEDNFLMVMNKPRSLAVQGGTHTLYSLDQIMAAAYPEIEPKITHRLDKDTSGLILFAKTRAAAQWLTAAFKDRLIEKRYQALVVGVPQPLEGTLSLPIGKMMGDQREKMSPDAVEAKEAITTYKTLSTHDKISFVELMPLTGRTHQLRVHMAHLGTPILGDGKYGGRGAHPFLKRTSLMLHCLELNVPYPNGKSKNFKAPLPFYFTQILDHQESL